MATKAQFVRGATRAPVAGLLVAAAAGLLYFLSLCLVDQGLAAFARGCPDKAQGVDPNDILFWPTRQGGELSLGLVGLTAWRVR